MSQAVSTAKVMLWGTQVGAVTWVEEQSLGYFQYAFDFLSSGIELSPLIMPLAEAPYSYPALPRDAFKGLPGLLADVLPDKFGNRLIDAWLAEDGRTPNSFTPVERLCYVGKRGMGALEFDPAIKPNANRSTEVDLSRLVNLANQVLDERSNLSGKLTGRGSAEALEDILQVGTSAGGARAKAVLAWHPTTGEFRSGQLDAELGFEHWLLKFDGVANNRDKELADPLGFGLVEYAYHKMAVEAGITMMPCRIQEEGGRSHFMTKRFDRFVNEAGHADKMHVQTLAALQHYDFNDPNGYSYEQALLTIREIGLGNGALEEQFRRAIFNVLSRNQDDHVKNIAFLMDRNGEWSLSPAYDVTYSYNASGEWTSQHQMSMNGKRDDFELDDLINFGRTAGLKPIKSKQVIESIAVAIGQWKKIAKTYGVDKKMAKQIARTHRTDLIFK
ncbi:MAG: serine/threonine-protein kinase HipA [bacterium]